MRVVRKEIRDRAIDLLEYFERQSLESQGYRDAHDLIVELLRDGCPGWVNHEDEDILNDLKYSLLEDSDLADADEETLEYHAELREVVSQMEADIAVANIVQGKLEDKHG